VNECEVTVKPLDSVGMYFVVCSEAVDNDNTINGMHASSFVRTRSQDDDDAAAASCEVT